MAEDQTVYCLNPLTVRTPFTIAVDEYVWNRGQHILQTRDLHAEGLRGDQLMSQCGTRRPRPRPRPRPPASPYFAPVPRRVRHTHDRARLGVTG